MLMTITGLLRVPLDLSLMGILLAENLLPALTVSLVKISVDIWSVEFYVVTCTVVMTDAMTMEMGISIVYTLYNTINSKDPMNPRIRIINSTQSQEYYPPAEEPTENTTTSHGKHLIYNDIETNYVSIYI